MPSQNALERLVRHLSLEIGPRPYLRPQALEKTRDFIVEKFKGHNRSIYLQDYNVGGKRYSNVVCSRLPFEAYKAYPRPLLVIGAHYDTVSSTPGADDNASGIAGLLELSRVMGDDLPEEVLLVAFTLEEPPFYRTRKMGSYRFARLLKRMGVRLKGMICLEMIGYFSDRPQSQHFPLPLMDKVYPSTGHFIALVGNIWSKAFTQQVEAAFKRANTIPVYSLNAPFLVFGVDLSDHWSFYKCGFKAVMVTDTAFYRNPHYHRPTDLPETLDYRRMANVVAALKRAVEELTGSGGETG